MGLQRVLRKESWGRGGVGTGHGTDTWNLTQEHSCAGESLTAPFRTFWRTNTALPWGFLEVGHAGSHSWMAWWLKDSREPELQAGAVNPECCRYLLASTPALEVSERTVLCGHHAQSHRVQGCPWRLGTAKETVARRKPSFENSDSPDQTDPDAQLSPRI